MNCTAFGLMTAVPFMLIHAWLTSMTDELVDNLEMASIKFLNSLGLKN
jgi:biopolymer transport protein ExbB/TolQ